MKTEKPELGKYMDKRLAVALNGGRAVEGVLRGYDQFLNLVLDDEERTLVESVDDKPVIEIGSGSGQRGSEWVARRLPKMRIAVNVKSSERRPLAAYRLRVTIKASKLVDNRTEPLKKLVCYTDAFYVIGRAYKAKGKESKLEANRSKNARSRAHTVEYRKGLSKAETDAAWPDNVWAE